MEVKERIQWVFYVWMARKLSIKSHFISAQHKDWFFETHCRKRSNAQTFETQTKTWCAAKSISVTTPKGNSVRLWNRQCQKSCELCKAVFLETWISDVAKHWREKFCRALPIGKQNQNSQNKIILSSNPSGSGQISFLFVPCTRKTSSFFIKCFRWFYCESLQ